MQRFLLFYAVPTLLLLLVAVWPLVTGEGTLYTRDVLSGHLPLKAAQAQLLSRGELPLVDPFRAGGQPLLGNPNALPLYPDNLLYLLAPPLWALNAHFWLHLLLAPLAVFWLARAWGLRRDAAWAAGVCYAGSGFLLSQLNLYNLVAGAALAPAFVAAVLSATGPRSGRLAWLTAGLLWTLLLLAGDPLFAAVALLLAGGAVAARPGTKVGGAQIGRGALALLFGTLVAAPMLVEFLRILPLSYRGYWQFSPQAALSQSWDPRTVLEWLLPFFFGRPDFTFWGMRYHGGNPPLLYSLYPGLLGLALVALAGRPRRGAALWAWAVVAVGLFFAAGAWNPLVRLLYGLPGASVLRYPVKLWLAVAVGAALLCGLGFERLHSAAGRRRLGRILAAMAALYLAAWAFLSTVPEGVLRALDPERLSAATLALERLRWSGTCLLSLFVLALLGAALWLARRSPGTGGALLLATHLAAQLFFLRPLFDTDEARHYTTPPEILEAVPSEALVVHGGFHDLFGKQRIAPLKAFPDPRFLWLARRRFAQLYPEAGVLQGRRYDFNHSPEQLGSFFSISLAQAIQRMPDAARVRVLAASGVDLLILDRALEEDAATLTHLEATAAAQGYETHVYGIRGTAAPRQLVGTILRAPHMNRALELLTDPAFDPRTMAVLPGSGETSPRPAGTVEVLRQTTEALELRVASPAGGVLTTRRAFLEIYRAAIDGEPAAPTVANVHRLALEVPPGEHRVRLAVDRRPSHIAWGLALLGLAGLLAIAVRPPRGEVEEGE